MDAIVIEDLQNIRVLSFTIPRQFLYEKGINEERAASIKAQFHVADDRWTMVVNIDGADDTDGIRKEATLHSQEFDIDMVENGAMRCIVQEDADYAGYVDHSGFVSIRIPYGTTVSNPVEDTMMGKTIDSVACANCSASLIDERIVGKLKCDLLPTGIFDNVSFMHVCMYGTVSLLRGRMFDLPSVFPLLCTCSLKRLCFVWSLSICISQMMHEFICCEAVSATPLSSSDAVPAEDSLLLGESLAVLRTDHMQADALSMFCKASPTLLDLFTSQGVDFAVTANTLSISDMSSGAPGSAVVNIDTCMLMCSKCGSYLGDGSIAAEICADVNCPVPTVRHSQRKHTERMSQKHNTSEVSPLQAPQSRQDSSSPSSSSRSGGKSSETFTLSDLRDLRLALHRVHLGFSAIDAETDAPILQEKVSLGVEHAVARMLLHISRSNGVNAFMLECITEDATGLSKVQELSQNLHELSINEQKKREAEIGFVGSEKSRNSKPFKSIFVRIMTSNYRVALQPLRVGDALSDDSARRNTDMAEAKNGESAAMRNSSRHAGDALPRKGKGLVDTREASGVGVPLSKAVKVSYMGCSDAERAAILGRQAGAEKISKTSGTARSGPQMKASIAKVPLRIEEFNEVLAALEGRQNNFNKSIFKGHKISAIFT
jgi:hypothetical protein